VREVAGQPHEQVTDPVGAAARQSPQHRPAQKDRLRAESERRSLARRSRPAMSTAMRAPPVCYGRIMTDRTYRVTEIVGTSPEGIEPAIRNAVHRAAQTLRHLDWFEVTEIRGQIRDDQVAHFQVGLKVGFRLEDT
jgi:flavin-binding protein dodecin